VPVSQKPRKTRHRTPPAATRQRRASPAKRFFVTVAISFVAVGLALLTVFSSQRQKQNADKDNPAVKAASTTSTVLDPVGGVHCPLPEGEARRDQFPAAGPPDCLTIGHTYKARITTDAGAFMVALDPTKAPRSVNVFVVLARYHFYDDLTFHKAVPGFFVQTGDPRKEGITGPGFTFDDQLPGKGAYVAGSVAMANGKPGANGSQFLILVTAAPGLSPQFPLFGQVVEGLDVVKKIADDGGEKGEPKVVHRLLRVNIIESV
jgi:cyclophilin family peptidyl-prolyl cis-trans isomerase